MVLDITYKYSSVFTLLITYEPPLKWNRGILKLRADLFLVLGHRYTDSIGVVIKI